MKQIWSVLKKKKNLWKINCNLIVTSSNYCGKNIKIETSYVLVGIYYSTRTEEPAVTETDRIINQYN